MERIAFYRIKNVSYFCVYFQKLGHEIISQLKNQKKQGKTGPLRLQKVNKKPSIGHGPGKPQDGDDEDTKFTNITDQLAFVKDIDLTKGQAFMKDSKDIEKSVKPIPNGIDNSLDGSQDKKSSDTEHSQVPNGNVAKTVKKHVKKPNGTPKSSPKARHFSSNRITPLAEDFEMKSEVGLQSKTKLTSDSTKKGSEVPGFDSLLGTDLDKDKEDITQFMVKPDDGYVSHASHSTSYESKSPNGPETVPRVGSADSKTLYDQWVNEIIEATPGPSPSKSDISASPGRKRHKEKKHKKDKKKDKKRDKDGSRESSKDRKKDKSSGSKTPTSDQYLLGESEDESHL